MRIETEYDWGQPLWYIWEWRKSVRVECSACAGAGVVMLMDKKTHGCPVCDARGYTECQGAWQASIEIAKISSVHIECKNVWDKQGLKETRVTYQLEYPDGKYSNVSSPLDDDRLGVGFFKTEGEAKKMLEEHPSRKALAQASK